MRSMAQIEWTQKAIDRAGQIPGLDRLVRRIRPEPRWKQVSRRALPFVATGGASALTAYLFDPDRGRARRARLKGRIAGTVRRSSRRARRTARKVRADAQGLRSRMGSRRPESVRPNDVTLAHKVESEALSKAGVDKGRLNINAEDGVIVLRGVVDAPEDMARLEARIRKVEGVRDVRTLLHLKNEPAHTKDASIEASHRAMDDVRRSG